jgi:hypothetical protein
MMKELASEIYAAGRTGRLPTVFRAVDVRSHCPGWGDLTYDRFLSKHEVDKPGRDNKLFIRVARGLYRLRPNLL